MPLITRKPTAIIYLRRQDVVFINKQTSVRLDIPVGLVQNLEVIDAAKLSELIAGFLDQQHCHGKRVLLALDPTVVFHKSISAKQSATIIAAANNFEYQLPFDVGNRQAIAITKKDGISFFGVNKQLHQTVVRGIQHANKLLAIVPAASYGVSGSKSVDSKIITALFTNTAPLKQPNFLTKT